MKTNDVLKIVLIIALLSGFLSCRRNPGTSLEEHCGKRDRIEDVELHSIEEKLPDIHAYAHVYMMGDTLIIHDFKSTDLQFVVYDIKEDKYIGKFGKFGEGPGEIANFGCIVIDPVKHILYGMSYATWHMSAFDINEALSDPDYRSFLTTKLKDIDGATPLIVAGDWVNDSIAYYEVRIPDASWKEFDNRIGSLNLNNGNICLIDDVGSDKKSRSRLTLSLKNKLVVSAARTHDRIRLFDIEGKLMKTIYGPDYEDEQKNPNTMYYCDVCIGKDGIYASYLNDDILNKRFPDDIIVMDLDGKYQKTLHVGKPITGMAYNENFNRLYLSTNDYPQFGYIQL